jgi:hypothetical protein
MASRRIARCPARACHPTPADQPKFREPWPRSRRPINEFGDETILRSGRNKPETNQGYIGGQRDGAKGAWEATMNHSIHSADRATHLKIVVVALVAGIAVAGFAISARTPSDYSQTAHAVKAGKPVLLTIADTAIVR